ncbi:Lrp/AsnC family transcriptional regulator [Comamonas endophytica]|uniref:Lrp/AsnC family transcriptional regulator n=1 Tax=Comamonas endophytica TaxID=2949090 RepID=A0ABY6GG83_9BURK|nr:MULTISPECIES: Lrp/AsnC family transcriptional regulator [unclassified Acidovorax]MCD2513312.1 Lrp/AsnC family transcriptional regulator [Acidovorax sp. D4N7]UYG53901.1 Lrp/AsnC family transcriptional regulator [Acidovorax sp. 5MLIR]
MPLDAIDYQILELLQRQGRSSARAIAERVHLSPRATLARIRALEQQGHLRGYHAELDRALLGAHAAVFAEVALKDQRPATAALFERHALACPEVVACHLVSGRFDYLVRFCCRDLAHYHALTNAWLDQPLLGIEKIVTSTELKTVKEFSGFPLLGAPRRSG